MDFIRSGANIPTTGSVHYEPPSPPSTTTTTFDYHHHLRLPPPPSATTTTFDYHHHLRLPPPPSTTTTTIVTTMPFFLYRYRSTLQSPGAINDRKAAHDAILLSLNEKGGAIERRFGVRNWIVVL